MMTKPKDDFDAVRIIVDILKDFKKEEQERIIRWAQEKVGFILPVPSIATTPLSQQAVYKDATRGSNKAITIKEFIDAKNPKKDIHFAAAVAYYYRFEAPEGRKKDVINSDDLQEACRLSTNRRRFKKPISVLNNAESMGLLDRPERGLFKINAVGENLVAMGLPADSSNSFTKQRSKKKRKSKRNKR